MKRALTYTLAVALLLSLTACGTTQAEQPAEPEPATTSSQANEPITTPEPSEIPEPAQTPEPSETPEPEQATEPASTDTVEPQTLAQTEPAADPEPEQTLKPKQTTEPTATLEPAQTTQGGGKTSSTDDMVIDGIIGSGTGDELTMSKEEAEAAGQGLAGLDQWAAQHQGGGITYREGDVIDGAAISNPEYRIDMN